MYVYLSNPILFQWLQSVYDLYRMQRFKNGVPKNNKQGARHNERAWRRRVGQPLMFMLAHSSSDQRDSF